jgi:hypothetical protein
MNEREIEFEIGERILRLNENFVIKLCLWGVLMMECVASINT